jgi:phosphotransferase system HPr (HPr) family protein
METETRPNTVVRVEATVSNREGLHARPLNKFHDLASKYHTLSITVYTEYSSGDAHSLLSLLTCCTAQGSTITIEVAADPTQQALAQQAADELKAFVDNLHEG